MTLIWRVGTTLDPSHPDCEQFRYIAKMLPLTR